jgi:hypothetical protein
VGFEGSWSNFGARPYKTRPLSSRVRSSVVRHTLFSVEQNLEIDKVVPVSASVKTKLGRGGSYED